MSVPRRSHQIDTTGGNNSSSTGRESSLDKDMATTTTTTTRNKAQVSCLYFEEKNTPMLSRNLVMVLEPKQ